MTSEVSIFSISNWNSMYLMLSGMIFTAIIGYVTFRINLLKKRKEEEAIINSLKTVIFEVIAEVYETKTILMKQESTTGKLTPEQIVDITNTCVELVRVRISKQEEEEYLSYISDLDKYLSIEVPMAYNKFKASKELEERLKGLNSPAK